MKKRAEQIQPRHRDQVFSKLKSDIIRCDLKPGSAVSEAKLASKYDVGKAPIRDALARLRQEGLVISQPRKGHIIAPITIRDVIDLYEVRLALEPVAAKMAAGQVDEAALRQVASACEVPIKDGDPEGIQVFLRNNSDFHRSIAQYSGNRRLAKQISDLLDDTERVRHILFGSDRSGTGARDAIVEHNELVEALISGSKDDAASLTKSHIQRGWRMVLSSLLSHFQFMDLKIGGPLDEDNTRGPLHHHLTMEEGREEDRSQILNLVTSFGEEHLGSFRATRSK